MIKKPIPYNGVTFVTDNTWDFNVERFLQLFKEFSKLEPDIVYEYGLDAIALLRPCSFGRFFNKAVALYTAHRLARTYNLGDAFMQNGMEDQSSTEQGANLSASTNSLTESSQAMQLANGDDPFTSELASTRYGLQLLALIRVLIAPADLVKGEPLGNYIYNLQWPPVNAGY